MDEIDRKLLNMMQEEFPVEKRPFAELGRRAGIDERDALERVRRSKDKGYIRRIGPVLEPAKLSYESTLCGVHVEEDILPNVVEEINRHRGVTHNYEREGELNVWFTVTAQSPSDIDAFIEGIERRFSLTIYRFPKKKTFKIRTFFPL